MGPRQRTVCPAGLHARLLSDGEGPNLVYACEKAGIHSRILRIGYLPLRTREDLLAETEYVRFLREHGGSVADVIPSRAGSFVETFQAKGRTLHACLFVYAPGEQFADRGYQYREGVPISAYYFDCGKTLGRLHRLSKQYKPQRPRYDFFGLYTEGYIKETVPASLPLLRRKMTELLQRMKALPREPGTYGMVHFDYCDGHYHIDFDTGHITVYDFDNCCTCWYLYDLADLWMNGTGWAGFEPDLRRREALMHSYFNEALKGYRTETDLPEEMLHHLPLFIQALQMEGILDYFGMLRLRGEQVQECEEWVSYRIRCLEEELPYMGFFHGIYDPAEPFECEPRRL